MAQACDAFLTASLPTLAWLGIVAADAHANLTQRTQGVAPASATASSPYSGRCR